MLSFSWDSAYESTPGNGLSRSSIDDTIRQMSRGVRERMEREHQWGYDTDEDTGRHIPGKTTVALRDNTATRTALTNMEDGAVYVETDGTNHYVYVYEAGTGWVQYSDNDHGNLENLYGTGHDDVYWKTSDDLDAASAELDMGGNILTAGTVTNLIKASDHINEYHDVVSPDALKDSDLTGSKLDSIGYNEYMYTGVSNGGVVVLHVPASSGIFAVQLIQSEIGDVYLGAYADGTRSPNIAAKNDTGSTITIRMRVYYE